jgi:NACalpha-BTF3-like transcription factor
MDLKSLIEKHTVDGEINFDEAEQAFQTHVNGIVVKNTTKEVDKYKQEYTTSFIKELGIEANDIEGVKKWVSNTKDNSTDFKEKNVTLQTELEKAMSLNSNLTKEYTDFKQNTLINQLGVDGEKAEFLKYKFNKNVTDELTFESQVENYKKENREDTYRQFNNNFEEGETSGPLEALKRIREKR